MKTSEVLTEFNKLVQKAQSMFPESLAEIILFGSYAKGLATMYSDLDIALVFKDNSDRKDKYIVESLIGDLPVEIQYVYTEERFLNTQDKFDVNYCIKKDGYIVWRKEATESWRKTI